MFTYRKDKVTFRFRPVDFQKFICEFISHLHERSGTLLYATVLKILKKNTRNVCATGYTAEKPVLQSMRRQLPDLWHSL